MNAKYVETTSPRPTPGRPGAFTLVELLLILTILAILASVVLPRAYSYKGNSLVNVAKVQIAVFSEALAHYKVDNGSYPTGREGLQALLVKPPGAPATWKGLYMQMDRVPLGPWGHAYVYECPGQHNPTFYDLYTLGKDARGGTNTIGNWTPD